MVSVREYSFEGLPKWSKRQVALQESLSVYLSYAPFREGFREHLAKELGRYLKVPCKLGLPELSVVSAKGLHKLLPDTTCIAVVGAAPTEYKILVEIDLNLISSCIDKLLGGRGKAPRIKRALTEIEQGVISFLFLKAIREIQGQWETGRELSLNLDRIVSTVEQAMECCPASEEFSLAAVRLKVAKNVGVARVCIPEGLVQQSFASAIGQGPSTEDERAYMRETLSALGDIGIVGRVEVAHLELSSSDLEDIEVGDIVVLDDHELQLTEEGLCGGAFLRIGRGQNGGVRGILVNEGELSKLQLSEIVIKEHPREENLMSDGADLEGDAVDDIVIEEGVLPEEHAGPQDNLEGTEGLLREVDAPVVVELGRIKLNTQQLVKLRAGQVIRLPRGSRDPVNLVVHDKLFARGELIEVDGELGVRLIQVTGH